MSEGMIEGNQTVDPTPQEPSGNKAPAEAPTNWVDSLPDELKEAPFIGKAKTPHEALQAIKNASAVMGNSIRIPSPEAGKDTWKEFYSRLQDKVPGLIPVPDPENPDTITPVMKALGVPDDPSAYKYSPPEGKEVPPETLEVMRSLAKEANLTQKQFEAVTQASLNASWEREEAMNRAINEGLSDLRKEWGLAYDQNVGQVATFLKLSDAPESVQNLAKEGRLPANDYVWLHSLAKNLKNPSELLGMPEGNDDRVMSPDEAQAQIDEIMNNPESPLWDPMHPRHAALQEKILHLHEAAFPED